MTDIFEKTYMELAEQESFILQREFELAEREGIRLQRKRVEPAEQGLLGQLNQLD